MRAGAAAPRASPAPMPAREATIAVHVAGAVRRPGMVILARGTRIDDAVRAVGGAVAGADLDRINLAAKLADGQQIRVPRRGESAPDAGSTSAAGVQAPGVAAENGGAAAGGPATGPIDINTATAAQFDGLPGIGPVLAQRLFQYRTEHGGFKRVEDLQQVEGIGPKKFAQLRSAVVCRP